MHEFFEYNSNVFNSLSETDLIDLFIHASEEENVVLDKFIVDRHLSALGEYQEIFSHLSRNQQEKWKKALLAALGQGMNPIMLYLIAELRLQAAIPLIFNNLSSSDLEMRDKALSVLGGFMKEVDLLSEFEALMNNPDFSESAPILLVSLAKANPAKALEYLLQFLDIYETGGDIDLDSTLFIFSVVCSPNNLKRCLESRSESERARILQYLCEGDDAPYIMTSGQFCHRHPEYYPTEHR